MKLSTGKKIFLMGSLLMVTLVTAQVWEYLSVVEMSVKQSKHEAKMTAEHVHVSVLEIIRKSDDGGGLLDDYVTALTESSESKGGILIRLVHHPVIDAEYTYDPKEQPENEHERASLADGKSRHWETEQHFIHAIPLMTDKSCGLCHHMLPDLVDEIPPGFTLALVEVKVPKTAVNYAREMLRQQTGLAIILDVLLVSIFGFGIYRISMRLSLSERKKDAIFRSIGEGIIVIGADGVIRSTNHELGRIFGYDELELVGQKAEILIPERYRPAHCAGMNRYLNGGEAKTLGQRTEKVGMKKDGTVFPIELRVEETFMEGSKERFFTAAIRDVTEQKRMLRELEKSETSLRKAQNIAKVGNWTFDTGTRGIECSREAARILGFGDTVKTIDYNAFVGVIHPDDRANVEQEMARALFEKKSFGLDHRIVRADGVQRTVHLQGEVETDDRGPTGKMVGIVQDITERKEAEEELRSAKDQAEDATVMKDKFVSLVSHDLKGPLATIIGYLRYIKNFSSEEVSAEVMTHIDSAVETGEKMTKLIDDLLGLGRFKTGRIQPRYSFSDAYFIVLKALSNVTHVAEKKGITLVNNIPKNTRIYADQTLFHQVLQNLLGNAVKFCKSGDSITLFVPEGKETTIAIADTGMGIKSERIVTLFKYEEKTSTVGTGGETGTGFGLPLSQDIMKAHGGELTVESELGKGSTFFASLPVVKPVVILAEDQRETRILFKAYLKNVDIEIIEAENGKKALEEIEKSMPHLVISDFNMPEMDGFDLLEQLRRNAHTEYLPFIMLTSDTSMETRERAFRMGADDFINKNVEVHDFVPRVRKYIG